MGQYDELVFKIPVENHGWYGFVSPRGFFRGTTHMEKAHLYMDFSAVYLTLPMETPHTHHAVDEYLCFTTANMNDPFDFDAEVDVWIGENPEKLELVHITSPTIIRVPPKMYHCPVNFKRINKDKPIVFSAVYCDGDWSKIGREIGPDGRERFSYDGAGIRRCVLDGDKECIYCGKCFSKFAEEAAAKAKEAGEEAPPAVEIHMPEEGNEAKADPLQYYYDMAANNPRTGKYDKFVYVLKPETHNDDRFLSPRGAFNGTDDMPESRLRMKYNIVQKPCELADVHMHHSVEEYLWFSGSDIAKFFEFDAEVEVALGPDPDNLTVYKITEPTIVRVPAGLWHSVRVTKLGAPIHFMPFYPSGEYGKITKTAAGYIYEGTDI